MTQTKVLLVENDPQFVYLVKRYVDICGCSLIHASGDREAIDYAKLETPDLILIDIVSHQSDGLQILNSLKKDPITSGIPTYICSASDSAVRGWEDIADGCLMKPVMCEDFMRVLTEVTAEHKIINPQHKE